MFRLTLSHVLDDVRSAEQALHRFEQRYWLSSDVFYELYTQGMLDTGENIEDFAEWAGHYILKMKREKALREFSQRRVQQLRSQADESVINLFPQEPVMELA